MSSRRTVERPLPSPVHRFSVLFFLLPYAPVILDQCDKKLQLRPSISLPTALHPSSPGLLSVSDFTRIPSLTN